jgi:TIR domain
MTTQRATGRIFIIHSQKDKELVRDMERRLRIAGLEPFGVPDGIPAGGEWKKALLDRLRKADAVLALVTPAALDSPWIMAELGMAEGFDKLIVPVTAGLEPHRLPAPLASYQAVPFDQLDAAISELARRLSDPLVK